jgi:M6 family metalloprotease-like protein
MEVFMFCVHKTEHINLYIGCLLFLFCSSIISAEEKIKGLCILIDFSDEPATVKRDDIENILNETGCKLFRNNGSVKDYFYDVSSQRITYTNTIPALYYRAKKPKSYYDDQSSCIDNPNKSDELVTEALKWLDKSGFDFASLTTDDENVVRALNFLCTGMANAGMMKGLWPHYTTIFQDLTFDGVTVRRYMINEIRGTATTGDFTIYSFCHENGHMLFGWPDLYDVDKKGVGNYCLMAYAADPHNPPPPCAYLRMRQGWTTVKNFNEYKWGTQVILKSNSNEIYKYTNPLIPEEYFLLESKFKNGSRLGNLPDDGLFVWHIDERQGCNNDRDILPENHYAVKLIESDGLAHHERGTKCNSPAFKQGKVTAFTDISSPSSQWWDSSSSGFGFDSVSMTGPQMKLVSRNTNGILSFAPNSLLFSRNNKNTDVMTIKNSSNSPAYWKVIPKYKDYSSKTSNDCSDLWIDISLSGILLSKISSPKGGMQESIALPFSFIFYNNRFQELWISRNGYIAMNKIPEIFANSQEYRLPSTGMPPNIIAGFADLYFSRNQGMVHYKLSKDKLTLQYTNMKRNFDSNSSFTFQIILHADGKILFLYKSMIGFTGSASIGLQNEDQSRGTQISFHDQEFIKDNMVLHLKKSNGIGFKISSSFGHLKKNESCTVKVSIENAPEHNSASDTLLFRTSQPNSQPSFIPWNYTR